MKMQAYSEAQDGKYFNWLEALQVEPDPEEWDELEDKANSWVTCACGNLCVAIPRAADGAPHDPILRGLGLRFMENIEARDTDLALDTLSKIEARSSEILKGMDVK